MVPKDVMSAPPATKIIADLAAFLEEDLGRGDVTSEALVAEVCKRLRQELVNCVEFHAGEDDPKMTALAASLGFTPIDAGTVFRKNG